MQMYVIHLFTVVVAGLKKRLVMHLALLDLTTAIHS